MSAFDLVDRKSAFSITPNFGREDCAAQGI
jgi:hypothetical protein